ncbi:MAG: ABC transporter permease [Candidatus Aminicenantes bacterium]|jgi:predicted permease
MKDLCPPPPKLARWLLSRLLYKKDLHPILGDFEEAYYEKLALQGAQQAKLWYWFHIVKSLPWFFTQTLLWSALMLQNYLKITFRNIKRYKGTSFITITGLAIGMACCLLILLWIVDEISYDRFHNNAENIYRVNSIQHLPDRVVRHALTPAPLAHALLNEHAEILKSVRITSAGTQTVQAGDKSFNENRIAFADTALFEIFSFPFIKGTSKNALDDPHTVIISEDIARKYYGTDDLLGQTITLNNKENMKITGVMKNMPQNSHFRYDFIFSLKLLAHKKYDLEEWRALWFNTYVLLQENVSYKGLSQNISRIIQKHSPGYNFTIYLQSLRDIRLYGVQGDGTIRYVYIFSAIVVFVLLIGCINFINLTTAQSGNRSQEIGIRRVAGAVKTDLVKQFLGESVFLSLFSFFLAILLVKLLLPVLNNLSAKQLTMAFLGNPLLLLVLLCAVIATGIISGIYPAFILSSYRIAPMIKGIYAQRGNSKFRKILVVSQFSLAILLIICTLIVFNQIHYMREKNLGFNKECLLFTELKGNIRSNLESLKNEWIDTPGVQNVTMTSDIPTLLSGGTQGLEWAGKDPETVAYMRWMAVDKDYLDTFHIDLKKGTGFLNQTSTSSAGFIINEEAVKLMGVDEPVGTFFTLWDNKGVVIGVVRNFHFASLHTKIQPLVLTYYPGLFYYVFVKIDSNNVAHTIGLLKKTWNKFTQGIPFDYRFLDEEFDTLYQTEERMGKIFTSFTLLALIIASMGLFGLTAHITEQRTKEIGIRKILGASVSSTVGLLSKEYVKWIFVSNLIAWPIAFFVIRKWLQIFPYRTSIGFWVFVLAGALALTVAMITVCYKCERAARANPVDSLRYE